MTPWWNPASLTLKALLLSCDYGVTGLAPASVGGGVQHRPGRKRQRPGCILRPGGSIQGGRRSQASGTGCLKWPEFRVQDRLRSHQATRLRCMSRTRAAGQPWGSSCNQLQALWRHQGWVRSVHCAPEGTGSMPRFPASMARFPTSPTPQCRRPPPPPPSSGCQRAACDCVLHSCSLPPEVRSLGWEEEVKGGKGRDLLPYLSWLPLFIPSLAQGGPGGGRGGSGPELRQLGWEKDSVLALLVHLPPPDTRPWEGLEALSSWLCLPAPRLMDLAKEMTKEALPIKCLEAVILGMYPSSALGGGGHTLEGEGCMGSRPSPLTRTALVNWAPK